MTLRHLKIFVTVCELGGITKAAEALYMTQPAVSVSIAELEKYYKVCLFERVKQRLIITDIGLNLLTKAKEVLDNYSDFESLALKSGDHPTIRVGCSLSLGQTLLPGLMKHLRKDIPSAEFSVVIHKTAMIEEMLEKGDLDWGIVEGDIFSSSLKATPIGHDSLIVVCSSRCQIPTKMTLDELVGHPLLLRENGSTSRNLLGLALSAKHLTVVPFLESVSNQCLLTAAMHDMGLAILPESVVADDIKRGNLHHVTVTEVDFKRTHYMLIHKNKRMNTLQQKAYDLAMDICVQK